MKLNFGMILFLVFTATLYFSPLILVYLFNPNYCTLDNVIFLILFGILFFIADLHAGLPFLEQAASVFE